MLHVGQLRAAPSSIEEIRNQKDAAAREQQSIYLAHPNTSSDHPGLTESNTEMPEILGHSL